MIKQVATDSINLLYLLLNPWWMRVVLRVLYPAHESLSAPNPARPAACLRIEGLNSIGKQQDDRRQDTIWHTRRTLSKSTTLQPRSIKIWAYPTEAIWYLWRLEFHPPSNSSLSACCEPGPPALPPKKCTPSCSFPPCKTSRRFSVSASVPNTYLFK